MIPIIKRSKLQTKLMEQHYFSNPSQTLEPSPSSSSTTTTTTSLSNDSSPFKTEINARHYKLILDDSIYDFNEQVPDPSELQRTSDKSTILHILASMPKSEYMINSIVQKCPTLLTELDSRGDPPLHIAVRAGHETVVRNMVEMARLHLDHDGGGSILMLTLENNEKNIALHIALENQQKGMAEFLFQKCQHVINCKNTKGISPLYLAIKAGFWDLVMKMIDAPHYINNNNNGSISRVFNDDQCINYSVIHAVIMAKNKGALEKIIQKYPGELQYSMDENGRRPLSYAAYTGFLEGVKSIINMKDQHNSTNYLYRNLAFKADKDGSFPIHAACQGGHIRVVEEMFSKLPENMMWLPNQKGQNILHVAAQFGKHTVVEYILTHPTNLGTMINMKDKDGYTPLHLGALGKNPRVVYDLTWDKRVKLNLQCKKGLTALDIADYCGDVPSFEERLTWLALVCAGVQRAPPAQLNNEQETKHIYNGLELHGKTTFFTDQHGIVQKVTNHPTTNKKHKHKYKERINTLLIISTLVATVTYASGFTVPGGYNNSSPGVGLATLDHKFAFQVFVISSSMAMYTSVLALVALIWAQLDDLRLVLVSLDVALPLLGTALVTMSVALMSGLYVALEDLLWLRVVVLVMGGVFLGVLLLLFLPLYSPTSCIRSRFLRRVFHVYFVIMLLACDNTKHN